MLAACSTYEAYQQIVRLQGLGAESKDFLGNHLGLAKGGSERPNFSRISYLRWVRRYDIAGALARSVPGSAYAP